MTTEQRLTSLAVHASIAFAITVGVGVVTGEAWIGAALAIGFYAGWEYAGRMYSIAARRGIAVYLVEPVDGLKGWTVKDALDLLVPALVAAATALLVS